MASEEPKVSVVLTTYNHERYIAAAIESVLCQETPFRFELLVADDGSTDGTAQVVRAFHASHPDVVRPLLSPCNIGMMRNFCNAYRMCLGGYVALLEGDDFWTSTKKLQRLSDALDQHPEWSGCFHSARVVRAEDTASPHDYPRTKPAAPISMPDVIKQNPACTCSLMFRRDVLADLPPWLEGLAVGDWPIMLLLASRGPLGFVDENMAVYRIHAGSGWAQQDIWFRTLWTLEMMSCVDEHLGYRFHREFQQSMCRLAWSAALRGPAGSARRAARPAIAQLLSAADGGLRSRPSHGLLVAALHAPRPLTLLVSRLWRTVA
ncbi:MAG: glycosyltransferase [Acidobacteriota bacterium]